MIYPPKDRQTGLCGDKQQNNAVIPTKRSARRDLPKTTGVSKESRFLDMFLLLDCHRQSFIYNRFAMLGMTILFFCKETKEEKIWQL